MKRKLLLLLLFFGTILFFSSCTKDYLGEDTPPQDFDITNTIANYGNHITCYDCYKCGDPRCFSCLTPCECGPCGNSRCPLCELCIAARMGSAGWGLENDYCQPCRCLFTRQSGYYDCFLTAMHYVADLTWMKISKDDIVNLFPGEDLYAGVETRKVSSMIGKVFGYNNLFELGICKIPLKCLSLRN